MRRIVTYAGFEPWPKIFRNMFNTRATVLFKMTDGNVKVVCSWIGNFHRDAVYRAVLLLRAVPTAYRQTGPIPRSIYDAVMAPLQKIRTLDPYSREFLERLRIDDVDLVVGKDYPVAVKMPLYNVFKQAGSGYDLFIHGDIGLWAGGEEEEFSIVLRAMDVETKEDLKFQPLEEEKPVVLVETRVPYKASNKQRDPKEWREHMNILADKVEKKLPRVRAVADPPKTAESIVSINRGTENRLFQAMSLCFYTYGDLARIGNVYLKKIGHGRINDIDEQSSRVDRPQLDLALIENGLIAITK